MVETPKPERRESVRYTPELGEKIADRIAGGESWLQLSKEVGMPAYPTFWLWKDKYPEFAAGVARARLISADWKADKALEVAERGTPTLHVNTLMSQAAKIAPSRWGPRAGLDEEGSSPKILVIRVRHFEKVAGPDGRLFVREVPPEPKDPAP